MKKTTHLKCTYLAIRLYIVGIITLMFHKCFIRLRDRELVGIKTGKLKLTKPNHSILPLHSNTESALGVHFEKKLN